MVRKIWLRDNARRGNIPESLLDTANIVHFPVLLGDILLANGNSSPRHTHLGNAVDIVLVKVDLEGAEVALGPLGQTPLLHDLSRFLQLSIFSGDVAIEDGELSANLGTLELTRRSAGESGNALRVCKGIIQFLSGGTELIRGNHGSSVDSNLAAGRSGDRFGGRCVLLSLRVIGWGGKTLGRVLTGGMLNILAMLSDQGRRKFDQLLSELGQKLRPHEVLHRLLGRGFRVDVNLKLQQTGSVSTTIPSWPSEREKGNIQHTRLPLCRGQPRGW